MSKRWYVRDSRPDSLARIEGPFTQEEAEQYATTMSTFVERNGPLDWFVKMTNAKVRGPFFAVEEGALTVAQKKEVARRLRVWVGEGRGKDSLPKRGIGCPMVVALNPGGWT